MKRFLSPSARPLTLLLLLSLAVFSWTTEALAAGKPALSIDTDRKDALYETGETVCFQLKITCDGKPVTEGTFRYAISTDGLNVIEKKSGLVTSMPEAVTATMDQPGFLQCRLYYRPTPDAKECRVFGAAGISVEKIQPSLPVPDDFDAFWADQKAQLAQIPMQVEMIPAKSSNPNIEAFDVKVTCVDGVPVSGYFARPKGAKPGSLPIVLWVHGAGVRSSSLGNAVKGASWGALSMDINAHGSENGKPASFYRDLSAGKLKDYRYAGRESRETSYFRGMYLRLVRAIDFLASQPEFNGKQVAVVGHSQGGGQALVAGGLDPRVTFIASGVPAMCDHTGRAINRINGWPKLVPQNGAGQPEPAVLEASRYVDAVNFASRINCGAIMSVGFIDTTCPPTTNYSAYNAIRGPKQVLNEPKMPHAAPAHIHKAFADAIQKHFGEDQKK